MSGELEVHLTSFRYNVAAYQRNEDMDYIDPNFINEDGHCPAKGLILFTFEVARL